MLYFKRPMWALFLCLLCLLLAACGGGSGVDQAASPASTVIAKPIPMLTYESDYPRECQSATIAANSINPADLADASSDDWTGNEYYPMTKDRYVSYCRSTITGTVSKTAFTRGDALIHIADHQFYDEGSIVYEEMPCAIYGNNTMVHTMTFVTGIAAPLKGYINLNVGMYDGEFSYKDVNGNPVTGVAELGNGGGVEFGGLMLAPQHPIVGQVINGSQTGRTSCNSNTTNQFGLSPWTFWTIDEQDHFGTAVNPVETTCLYEYVYGNFTCSELSKDVGVIAMWTIHVLDVKGNFMTDANGDFTGQGFIYNAIRTDRQGIASPTGTSTPWTADN